MHYTLCRGASFDVFGCDEGALEEEVAAAVVFGFEAGLGEVFEIVLELVPELCPGLIFVAVMVFVDFAMPCPGVSG